MLFSHLSQMDESYNHIKMKMLVHQISLRGGMTLVWPDPWPWGPEWQQQNHKSAWRCDASITRSLLNQTRPDISGPRAAEPHDVFKARLKARTSYKCFTVFGRQRTCGWFTVDQSSVGLIHHIFLNDYRLHWGTPIKELFALLGLFVMQPPGRYLSPSTFVADRLKAPKFKLLCGETKTEVKSACFWYP